ncbi:hypothetical protein GS501_02760 [Saccharibacter sp. 17.LH.SD]|uniref:2OG-Fe dioxygenase family protein n=1 Tax=Saccharibacter sp. 17.LH.SD TaxID=2689393 RepID=UPI00136AAD90|nr:2OG-Fe dioxygenase family protein [Saccharibacter sp. 17.LH.SD]MXV43974.1 hypothetical protein [Saccharibacter sp. 17.LH.SD]
MTTPSFPSLLATVTSELKEEGYVFLPAPETVALLQHYGLSHWDQFSDSWNHLGVDQYMADGGLYRRRRYATFSIETDHVTRKKHQPHYQSRDYNLLNGGIERWFSPIEDTIGNHSALAAILKTAAHVANSLTPETRKPQSWHAEVHQFRIEADPHTQGRPTPEGMHRDGVDWVFVFMIRRENIREGVTSIHALDQKTQLGAFTLAHPLDAAFVNDHRVYHGVTAVEPVDPNKPAYRDVLVVTLRYE